MTTVSARDAVDLEQVLSISNTDVHEAIHHVRDNADLTLFLATRIARDLPGGSAFDLPEDGARRRVVVRPLPPELVALRAGAPCEEAQTRAWACPDKGMRTDLAAIWLAPRAALGVPGLGSWAARSAPRARQGVHGWPRKGLIEQSHCPSAAGGSLLWRNNLLGAGRCSWYDPRRKSVSAIPR